MSFGSSIKTLQSLQRRSFHQWKQISRVASTGPRPIGAQSGPIHVPSRNFGCGRSRIFEHWARHRWADAAKGEAKANSGGKRGGDYGKFHGKHMFGHGHGHWHNGSGRDFVRMCRRYHGYGHWKGGILGGISFGSALSIVISYNNYQSIVWAMIHGFLSWIYVIYYALSEYNSQEKSANELIESQMKEVSIEIEKLNRIYQKVVKEVEDENNNQIKNKAIDDTDVIHHQAAPYAGGSAGGGGEFEQNTQMLEQLKERIDELERQVDRKE